jgi:DNA-binding transcriptional regulator YhcF (GntR family)
MKPAGIYDIIRIDEFSATPKYQQIINAILKGIEYGRLKQQTVLPSINDLSYELDVSRNTAEKAYRQLKKNGVISSVPGKGYFIKTARLKQAHNICLLFNKLSIHKKIIYDSFVRSLGENAIVDFYIYNNDFSLFRKLLADKKEDYTHYVIITHFLEGGENAHDIINAIPKEKLLLLDKLVAGVKGTYAAIYEDFENDIYNALAKAVKRLKKYKALKIIFPDYTYHPREILNGFFRFCQDYAFDYEVIEEPLAANIKENTVYISLMEDDLVPLIKKIREKKLEVGKQVGVISYNETPIKEIILNGITTISSDFKFMGEKAAEIILNKSTQHFAVPFYLTLRNSL